MIGTPRTALGLVPHGMTLEQAKKYATFNARAESLTEKPMFRGALQACVIPLAGFWEWPELHGKKTRTRIDSPDGKPMLVAGLWNCGQTPDGPLESCAIITRRRLGIWSTCTTACRRCCSARTWTPGWTPHLFRRAPRPAGRLESCG